jgi:DNA-binding transcriptional LysR family regulator
MKINSAHLEAFYSIAKTLNFTRAAEALHVTQSALSQRIAKLEEDLETTLFIRDKKSIRLTIAGEQVLRHCQVMDGVESELLSKLKNSGSDLVGTIRIGGFSSVTRSLLIPSLKKIMQDNPKLSIQLMTKEIRELHQLLKSAEVDYILTSEASNSPDIESIFLGYEANVLVKSKKLKATDVFLDHDENDPVTKWYCSQTKANFKISQMRYLDDVYGLIDGVKNEYGIAVLPLHLIKDEKDLDIIDKNRILKVPIYLQFFSQPYYRKTHSVLAKDIQEFFRKNLKQSIA